MSENVIPPNKVSSARVTSAIVGMNDAQVAEVNAKLGTGGGLPAATNADVVALSSTSVAVTPASLVDGDGNINWLNGKTVLVGGAGNVLFGGAGYSFALSSTDGNESVGIGTAGIDHSSDAGTPFTLTTNQFMVAATSSFTVKNPGAAPGYGCVITSDSFDGSMVTLAQEGGNYTTSLSGYQLLQIDNTTSYSGSLRLAGSGASMTFSNGSSPVPITTDGGAIAFGDAGFTIGAGLGVYWSGTDSAMTARDRWIFSGEAYFAGNFTAESGTFGGMYSTNAMLGFYGSSPVAKQIFTPTGNLAEDVYNLRMMLGALSLIGNTDAP